MAGYGLTISSDFAVSDLLAAMPVAVYMTDTDGVITFFNEAAAELWGNRPTIGSTKWCGSWRLRHPDGSPMALDECPMAKAIRAQHEVGWGEAVAERPDGTLVPFLAHPTPLRNASGTTVAMVNTLLDLRTQMKADEARMRLVAIVESSMDAIVSKDINGVITSWNDAAEHLFGYTASEAIGRPVTILIPEDHLSEETSIISRIRAGERVPTYETIRRRRDGSLVPVSLTVSPIRDAIGRIIGASKIARDISGYKESEERIRVLMREVNHRVKNQYSVIISMVRETRKRAVSPEDFERQVRERIMALAASHDLLVTVDWRGATVGELLRAQVKAFVADERVEISGPPVVLQPNAIQYLGIAFHELATNSVKYGALSSRSGSIRVAWETYREPDGSEAFRLLWQEIDGPRVTDISEGGFGMVVLERVTPQSLSGTGHLDSSPHGITWTLQAPLRYVEVPTGLDVASELTK